MNPRTSQGHDLGLSEPDTVFDNRTGMPHAAPGWRMATGNVGNHRFFVLLLLQVIRRLFFGCTPNLADQYNTFGLRVRHKQLQAVAECHPLNRVCTNTDTG